MIRYRLFVMLAVSSFWAASQQSHGQVYQGRELVKAEVLAGSSAIVPGQPFTVGLLLRMAPGWHTYWKFPGDAGIPTELKWQLPPGWKAGEVRWPIPLKLSEPGDIEIYGYHDEVMLLQEITPPGKIQQTKVNLPVEANWLVCEKICIPGGARLQLDLPIAGRNAPANQELFAKYERALPQAWPGEGTARAKWEREGATLRLTIQSSVLAAYPAAEFYPLPPSDVVVAHPSIESRDAQKVAFRVPIETNNSSVVSIDGIISFGNSGSSSDRNAWRVLQPGSASATAFPVQRPQFATVAKFLGFGFLGGFILNLMPCVLPVISLKIFGFVQQAGQSRRQILRSGLAFTLGIFAWFIGLALLLVALKAAGREITWAFQFTNSYFVLAMSAVVVVFALNLFGVFEIALPERANRSLLGWSAREGDAGSFFQGVFATVLATPCTAPFLGAALGFAFTQSSLLILAIFFAIAAGMSTPYVLLSARPGWIQFLPKPGPWMLRVKQLMGFFLLATLLFLLWVLGAQRGTEAVIWTSCFLLALALASWIKGAWLTPMASIRSRVIAWAAVVILVGVSGLYFIGEKFRESRLASVTSSTSDGWQPFSPATLQRELDSGHAVFVDFTAAWCLTCKFNESTVLESAPVREAFERGGVIKLRADWTNADPVITKILKQFGRPGVPLYVLYPAGNSSAPILFPELLTQGIVLDKLKAIGRQVAAQ